MPDFSKFTSSILITGGTQGLGYHTAHSLSLLLPSTLLILASRTDSLSSASKINASTKHSNAIFLPLDLSSLSSVRTFCSTFLATTYPPLSGLILNAGIQLPGDTEFTPDGIEKHFGVNHVAHSLLFHLLAPRLTATARVVVVASGLHDPVQGKQWGIISRYSTPANAAKGAEEGNGRDRYATSKTANVLWAFALSRHLPPSKSGVTVVAFDPGLMFGTGFARDASWFARMLNVYVLPMFTGLFRRFVHGNVNTPKESGGNLAWVVTSEEVKGLKGMYFEKRGEAEASKQARDEGAQEELWEWTVERIARDEGEKERFERVE
jgi:NAD(P)-dependent dehydrogenase (short-subunit alcohol dehydrogenase family)